MSIRVPVGEKFGRWTVLRSDENSIRHWICSCECGTVKSVDKHSVSRGCSQSCGCLAHEALGKRRFRHGKSHYKVHSAYFAMMGRCYNQNNIEYPRYGARGIAVCDRWRECFDHFLEDMGDPPTDKHSLDRIDNNGSYCKENCRWADKMTQSRNRRSNHLLTHNGETFCITEWAERLGLTYCTIKFRLRRGWSVERALTTPMLSSRRTSFAA